MIGLLIVKRVYFFQFTVAHMHAVEDLIHAKDCPHFKDQAIHRDIGRDNGLPVRPRLRRQVAVPPSTPEAAFGTPTPAAPPLPRAPAGGGRDGLGNP